MPFEVKHASVYPPGPGYRPAPAAKMAALVALRSGTGTKKTSLNFWRADIFIGKCKIDDGRQVGWASWGVVKLIVELRCFRNY